MSARNLAASVRNPELVVLDGFHAVKHALRFGAEVTGLWTTDAVEVERLRAELAPDLPPFDAVVLTHGQTAAALGREPITPLVGVARRPPRPVGPRTGSHFGSRPRPIVALVHPRHLGNVGAVVRAAAAAEAGGVVVVGTADPWSRPAVRGAAGLQFALPVLRVDSLGAARDWAGRDHSMVAMGEGGTSPLAQPLPRPSLLLFGTERDGLPADVIARADRVATLPMSPGVSSLNLATAVAATLYLDLASH